MCAPSGRRREAYDVALPERLLAARVAHGDAPLDDDEPLLVRVLQWYGQMLCPGGSSYSDAPII